MERGCPRIQWPGCDSIPWLVGGGRAIKVNRACVYYSFVTAGVPLRVLHCVTLTRFVAPRHVMLMGTDTSSLTLVT